MMTMMVMMMLMMMTMLMNLLSATPQWSTSSVESNCFPRSSISSELKSLEQDDITVCPNVAIGYMHHMVILCYC